MVKPKAKGNFERECPRPGGQDDRSFADDKFVGGDMVIRARIFIEHGLKYELTS